MFSFRRIATSALWLIALWTLLLAGGCTATVRVRPRVTTFGMGEVKSDLGIALHVVPSLKEYRWAATKHLGLGDTLHVEYDLGPGLEEAVADVVGRLFREVHEVDSKACSAGLGRVLVVEFAKPPEIDIRWVDHVFTVGGGSTIDLALAVTGRSCNGHELWRRVVTGYASHDYTEAFYNWPDGAEFRPAAEQALRDVSSHLRVALRGVSAAEWGEAGEGKEETQ